MDIKEARLRSAAGSSRHPWELARLAIVERMLAPLLLQAGGDAAVLDLGCGDAFVSAALAKANPRRTVLAVDSALTGEAAESLRARLGLTNLKFFQDIRSVDVALAQHELVKIKFAEFKEQKKELAPQLADKTTSHIIMRVGNVVVLHRPRLVVEAPSPGP